MNKHFEDARYYLKRAGDHAKKGIAEEIEPLQKRVQRLVGREEEPEPSRLDELREDLKEIEERAEGEAKNAIGDARHRIRAYRND